MRTIFISIIISSYNSEETISETLESVTQQTYPNWECIIVDDGSTDNTVKIVENYIKENNKFSIITNKHNSGRQAKVLNQGIKRSKYNYILILDSDDLIIETCLELRINKMDLSSDMNIFPNTCLFKTTIGDMKYKKLLYNHNSPKYLSDFIIHKIPTSWQVTSVFWKKDSLIEIGGFNENMIRIVDVELSCRALIYGLKFKIFPNEDPDFFYRITSNPINTRAKRMRFYKASKVFIKEIYDFTNNTRSEKIVFVKKYLRKFYFSVLTTVLISKDFNKSHVQEFINYGIVRGLIKKNLFTRNIFQLKKISELPIINSSLFHIMKLYTNY